MNLLTVAVVAVYFWAACYGIAKLVFGALEDM